MIGRPQGWRATRAIASGDFGLDPGRSPVL